jgi:hypothetical protein
MLEKVLYLVNFEAYEPDLIRCLTRLKEVGCRELVLLHLPKTEEVLHHIPSLLKDDLRQCLGEVTQKKLDALGQLCQDYGVTARPLIGRFSWSVIQHHNRLRRRVSPTPQCPFIGGITFYSIQRSSLRMLVWSTPGALSSLGGDAAGPLCLESASVSITDDQITVL